MRLRPLAALVALALITACGDDDGPVVYETLTHMTQLWPVPE